MATKKNTVPQDLKEENFKSRALLLVGFALVLFGVFLTLSIFSYCTTWQQDQSSILSSDNIWYFIARDQNPVANMCGRLGAASSHFLVYNTVGIVSILFSLWIAAVGINTIYGARRLPTVAWLRWLGLGIFFFCPLLAVAFTKAQFPYGGQLGSALVAWTQGVAGWPGTITMLVLVGFFFIIMIFKWDIQPAIIAAKNALPKWPTRAAVAEDVNAAEAPHPDSAVEENDTAPLIATALPFAENTLSREQESSLYIDNEVNEVVSGITMVDRTPESPKVAVDEPRAIVYEPPTAVDLLEEEDYFEIMPSPIPFTSFSPTQDPSTILNAEELEIVNAVPEPKPTAVKNNASVANREDYAPELDLPRYKFPTLDLLVDHPVDSVPMDKEELLANQEQIRSTLKSFGIEIQKIRATVGPTVTLYEIVPAEGVRISKIRNLEDDIALNLAALGIRMIAPIPGKGTIGIEVPNAHKQIVSMKELLSSDEFVNSGKMSLPIALGKKIDNKNYIVDLATMPHLLVAGATGQGKSVGINAILVSLLYKKHPSQLKFVMVDPKIVELSIYRKIEKHYLAKLPDEEEAIITDTKKVVMTLNSLCIEMDNRYELLKDANVRNLKEYNDKFIKRKLNPNDGHKYLPFIVLVIDEFADLIMTAGKEVEMPIARLAQKARAVGIHIIVATQRPSVNVITGVIKANFPARIAFKVSAKVDSRTILDTGGAEQLIGRGDMLISHGSELLRLQCAFVDTPEVEEIVDFIGAQQGYPSAFELPEYEGAENDISNKEVVDLTKRDKMFEDCAIMVVNAQSGSTSMLQRKLNLGYNRAGRIMDQLEAAGIVGQQIGSKPREVMISTEYELTEIFESLNSPR